MKKQLGLNASYTMHLISKYLFAVYSQFSCILLCDLTILDTENYLIIE